MSLSEAKKKFKKVLFISPDMSGVSAYRQYQAPPLGVVRLAGYLNSKGHYAEYFDPNLYACSKKGFSLEETLKKEDWDMVGFSILDETLLQDIQNIYLAQKNCPTALLIAGGVEAQFNYQEILDKTPCKIVVLGEGEVPMQMIADGEPYNDIPGIVVKNNAVALSEKLFNEATHLIPWETINYEEYWDVYTKMYGETWNDEIANSIMTVRVFSRNRCPIGCKFCSSTFQLTLASDSKVPVRSVTEENLIHVIERIQKSHPRVRMIYLTDDDFIINKASVIRFCKAIVERPQFKNLRFMCFSRITDLSEEIIQWLHKANFVKLNIGVESWSQKVLDEMGKRCDVNEIDPALKLLKKYNIRPYMNVIMTTPKSTLEDVELSVDKIMEYIKDPFYMSGSIIGIRPLRGTTFYEEFCDFKSYIAPIKGSNYKIRRNELIWSEDPLVRELQTRYLAGETAQFEKFTSENDVRHPNLETLSLMYYRFVKKIIKDIRTEIGSGGLRTLELDDDAKNIQKFQHKYGRFNKFADKKQKIQ
jgi:radical SAM superfamily enzyme YgiQ (UPF0313 family)